MRDAADDRQVAGAQTLPHTTVAAMDLSTWTPDFSTQFGPLGNFADFSADFSFLAASAPKICPPAGHGAADAASGAASETPTNTQAAPTSQPSGDVHYSIPAPSTDALPPPRDAPPPVPPQQAHCGPEKSKDPPPPPSATSQQAIQARFRKSQRVAYCEK